jgi:hypothetical protein
MTNKGWARESARHALASRGVKTAQYSKRTALARACGNAAKQVKVPSRLYHGTSLENLDAILQVGLKAGFEQTSASKECGFTQDVGWISLADNPKSAVFFSAVSMLDRHGQGQAIIEIDPDMLPEVSVLARSPLFQKHFEYQFLGKSGIPPEAITWIQIRKFNEHHKLLSEEWITPAEWRARNAK